jgi:hypothetical protein
VTLAILGGGLAVSSAASAEVGRASMEVGVDLGFIPGAQHGSITSVTPTAGGTGTGGPGGVGGVPPTVGDSDVPLTGGAIGAQATLLYPMFGPGLPRMMIGAAVNYEVGRKKDVHLGAASSSPGVLDGGITLSRNWTVDLVLGGVFPLCNEPTCLDLRVFIGATFLQQSITAFVDEAGEGGSRVENSGSSWRPNALFGTLVTLPFGKSVRLRLGAIFRSPTSWNTTFTSSLGRTSSVTIDGAVETQLTAGIAVPFNL